MYFKSEYHEELFNEFLAKLKLKTLYKDYVAFVYVASAIYKKEIARALGDHVVEYDKLLKFSNGWSGSEKKMLEFAYQCLTGHNLFEVDFGGKELVPTYPTIFTVLSSLDSENTRVVLEAIQYKNA